MKKAIIVIMAVLTVAGLAACTNEKKDKKKEEETDGLAFYYRISGDDETGRTTIRLQFLLPGGLSDSSLLLEEPSHVTLDGEKLAADSSRLNGIYYETDRATDSFTGQHEIVFTDNEGKKYTEPFVYTPFSLAGLPDSLTGNEDLQLEISGLDDGEFLHLIIIDTSFRGNGVEKIEPVKNGKLVVSAEELASLKKGPVYLDLIWDKKRTLKSPASESGLLFMNYRMKREVFLR